MYKDKETAKLFQDYQGLLRKAASQNYLRSIKEDSYAQAVLIFCEAINTFDAAKEVPFAGYAKSKVYRDLYIFFRRHRRNWQKEVSLSGSDEENTPLLAAESPEKNIIRQQILSAALEKLSARQRSIVKYTVMQHYTQKETAEMLGISQQSVAAQKKQALKHLKKYLIEYLGEG